MEKSFIKLGDKIFNLNNIDFIEVNSILLVVKIIRGESTFEFKFIDKNSFVRIESYIKMFSNEFDCTEVIHKNDSKTLLD